MKIFLILFLIGAYIYPQSSARDSSNNKGQEIRGVSYEFGGGLLLPFKSKNYESSAGADLFFEVRSTTPISLRANFGLYSSDTRVNYLSKGNASFILFELSLLLRAMSGNIQPFAGIGIGFYKVDNSLDEKVIQFFHQSGYGVKEEIENGAGYHFRGGVDLLFKPNFGFFIEMKYLSYSPDVISTAYELEQPSDEVIIRNEVELSNLNLLIGVFLIL